MLAQELLTDKNLSHTISSGLSRFVSPRDLVDALVSYFGTGKRPIWGLVREENT